MTKEERPIIGILKKYSSEVNNWNDAVFSDKFEVVENDIINVMQEYADQQTKDKDKEIERCKKRATSFQECMTTAQAESINYSKEITQLKQQLKEKSEEVERLRNEVFKVWNEDNGSVQMNTPIAWYRVLRIAEELNNQ